MNRVPGWVGAVALAASAVGLVVAVAAGPPPAECASGRHISTLCVDVPEVSR